MKEKQGFFLGLCTGIVMAILVITIGRFFGLNLFPSFSMADKVWEKANVAERYIDKFYWKTDISDDTLSDYAVKGIVSALGDKYSAYYTKEEYESAMNSVSGEYAGIGITVKQDEKDNRKIITEVQKGKPGDLAGLKVEDEIVKIDGIDVTKETLNEAVSRIRGEEGKKTELCIRRKESGEYKLIDITVTSEKIVHQSVESKMVSEETGYIKVTSFDNETPQQFEDALNELDNKGQKGLIIDLRNNGGGALTAAIRMLDDILPAGDLITEKNRGKESKVYKSTDDKKFEKPIAVLINGGSASASEVFSGTLQDRGAATLVGEKSYGKGIIQTIFSLENSCGGGIKLTTGEYLLPSGRSIHEEGLTPDVACEYNGATDDFGGNSDNQLKKAIEVLNGKYK